jgi:tetratricopeptide (TPR) repeat protein
LERLRNWTAAGGERAFKNVVASDQEYSEGWINLARVYLQEGELDKAENMLDRVEITSRTLEKARFFRAMVHKARGDYEKALSDLNAVAAAYPRDRVVLNEVGRVHYLSGAPERAIPWFEDALGVDSEDLMAHYNLMLVYRAAGDSARATHHETHYLRYKADETSVALSRSYRRSHPSANNEAQAIHEHTSAW